MRRPAPSCPKCGARMGGPRFDAARNVLVFACFCGYETTEPPDDAKKPESPVPPSVAAAESLAEGRSSLVWDLDPYDVR